MLCEDCRQRAATVHLTRIINNKKEELHLCEDCAQRRGGQFGFTVEHNFSFQDLLAGLLESEPAWSHIQKTGVEKAVPEGHCPGCKLSYADFKQTGFLGWPEGHVYFNKIIVPFLRKYHGGIRHIGKVPQRTGKFSCGLAGHPVGVDLFSLLHLL